MGTFSGWGIVVWFSQGVELAASAYPALRAAVLWQAWLVGMLASVFATVCGMMGYQLVITVLATAPISPQITHALNITGQPTIRDWTLYLVVGLIGGFTSGLLADGLVWVAHKARAQ